MASLNFNIGFKQEPVGKKSFVFKDVVWNFDNSIHDTTDDTQKTTVDGFVELTDEECILNGIKNIFRWKRGERIILPEFGDPLSQYLYEPINDLTAKNIASDINVAIQKWEPRAKIININVTPDTDNNTYYLELTFYIPTISTNKSLKFNLKLSTF